MSKPKIGWLVMKMSQKMELTNGMSVDATDHPQLWGICLVFRRKTEAQRYAGKDGKIYAISFPVEAPR